MLGRERSNTASGDGARTACFYVKDTGYGISANDLPHIFERFYQGRRTPNAKQPGTGLGLYVVDGLVKQLQGRITVESEIGRGSTFMICINHSDTETQRRAEEHKDVEAVVDS